MKTLRRRLFGSHLQVMLVAGFVLFAGMAVAGIVLSALGDHTIFGRRHRDFEQIGLFTGLAAAAIASALVSWRVAKRLAAPIEAVGAAARQLGAGRYDVRLPGSPDDTEGLLLRSVMAPGQNPVLGRYRLNPDDSLVLSSEVGDIYAEERLWFAAPNLRLRTSLMRQKAKAGEAGFENSSFYSEIRMVPPPEKAVA